jgi:hypothetical protein
MIGIWISFFDWFESKEWKSEADLTIGPWSNNRAANVERRTSNIQRRRQKHPAEAWGGTIAAASHHFGVAGP